NPLLPAAQPERDLLGRSDGPGGGIVRDREGPVPDRADPVDDRTGRSRDAVPGRRAEAGGHPAPGDPLPGAEGVAVPARLTDDPWATTDRVPCTRGRRRRGPGGASPRRPPGA